MAVEVISRFGGVSVRVTIRDSRPSGVALVLVCESELMLSGEGGGTVYLPSQSEDSEDQGTYQTLAKMGVAKTRYRLDLDTSELPFGVQQFDLDGFAQAAAVAAARGQDYVRLTPETAKSWGYVNTVH